MNLRASARALAGRRGENPAELVVHVHMSYDASRKQWRAAAAEHDLTARGFSDAQACRRISKLLSSRLGPDISLHVELEPPEGIAERVRAFQTKHDTWRELDENLRMERLPIANVLLLHRLSLSRVAELVRISVAQLTVLLRRDAIGEEEEEHGRRQQSDSRGASRA